MNRRKKNKIKLNDVSSVENLLQETYIDACNQIVNAQQVIDYLTLNVKTTDIDEMTKLAKERTNALKLKETAAKMKLEIGKLMNEIIKHNGSLEDAIDSRAVQTNTTTEGFQDIRDMIRANSKKEL